MYIILGFQNSSDIFFVQTAAQVTLKEKCCECQIPKSTN